MYNVNNWQEHHNNIASRRIREANRVRLANSVEQTPRKNILLKSRAAIIQTLTLLTVRH